MSLIRERGVYNELTDLLLCIVKIAAGRNQDLFFLQVRAFANPPFPPGPSSGVSHQLASQSNQPVAHLVQVLHAITALDRGEDEHHGRVDRAGIRTGILAQPRPAALDEHAVEALPGEEARERRDAGDRGQVDLVRRVWQAVQLGTKAACDVRSSALGQDREEASARVYLLHDGLCVVAAHQAGLDQEIDSDGRRGVPVRLREQLAPRLVRAAAAGAEIHPDVLEAGTDLFVVGRVDRVGALLAVVVGPRGARQEGLCAGVGHGVFRPVPPMHFHPHVSNEIGFQSTVADVDRGVLCRVPHAALVAKASICSSGSLELALSSHTLSLSV